VYDEANTFIPALMFFNQKKFCHYLGETMLIIMMDQLLIKKESRREKESRTHAVCSISSVLQA